MELTVYQIQKYRDLISKALKDISDFQSKNLMHLVDDENAKMFRSQNTKILINIVTTSTKSDFSD